MRRSGPIAFGVWVTCILLALIGGAFLALGGVPSSETEDAVLVREVVALVVGLAYPTMGLLVARRLPRNPVGWLLLLGGFAVMFENAGSAYATFALYTSPGSVPGGGVVAAVADTFWVPGMALSIGLLLFYPSGTLLSRRLRPVPWIAGVAAGVSVPLTLFAPGPLYYAEDIENPLGVDALGAFAETATTLIAVILLPTLVLAIASAVMRFRRSRGIERQQMKWFVTAAAFLTFVALPLAIAGPDHLFFEVLLELAGAFVPLAIGVAILRYRLYDIDVIINRALVYAALTAILVGCYLGLVLTLQFFLNPITRDSDIAVAASTLGVAALVRPVRARLQRFIDRRFYRSRYDAARTLEAFGSELRDEVDLDAVQRDTVGVVKETVQPSHVSLWIRSEGI